MDCKMKLEPIIYRERSLKFFWKSGISWHGTVVLFRREADGYAVGDHLAKLVIDHIPANDSMQDSSAVIYIFDAIVERIALELTPATTSCVVTDNARTYQNE